MRVRYGAPKMNGAGATKNANSKYVLFVTVYRARFPLRAGLVCREHFPGFDRGILVDVDVLLVTYIPREEYFGAPPDSANLARDFVNFHVLVLGSTIAHNQRELPGTNRCNPVKGSVTNCDGIV